MKNLHGLLLVDKPEGISSFHVIERIQRILRDRHSAKKKELPKIGHGGTLDPFATGLLVLCVGDGVKLSRYLLESTKTYDAEVKFGEASASGDFTDPVAARTENVPASIESIRAEAAAFTRGEYWQVPPMFSAKKIDGKPLYELARQGIEVERKPKLCRVTRFDVSDYSPPFAQVSCSVSSGTYIRVLAVDLPARLDSLALLTKLRRTASGPFLLSNAATPGELEAAADWTTLPAYVDFDRVLEHFPKTRISDSEDLALRQGKQETLGPILERAGLDLERLSRIVLYEGSRLAAVAVKHDTGWGLERVFTRSKPA